MALRKFCRRVGGDRQRTAADLALDGDGFVSPAAVAAIPLPVRVEARQRPGEIARWLRVCRRIEQHDVEVGVLVFGCGEVFEQRLDADAFELQIDRQRQIAFDRATADPRAA